MAALSFLLYLRFMSEEKIYFTVNSITEGLYKEKGSKFLSFAIPCASSSQAKDIIQDFRKKHPNAVHVCFAWRFGIEPFEDRFSDDGEPSGSAGRPIFGQLIAFNLTNILLVVVRYYGGTNLGVGGLMQANKTASKEALQIASIINYELKDEYELYFNFENTGEIMQLITRYNATIIKQQFSETGTVLHIEINQSDSTVFCDKFNDIRKGKLNKISS